MSKRYLRELVETGRVDGWDDPRMPTLCGMRRRGYTPTAILDFVRRAGVAKAYSVVDVELLEYCIRNELNATAPRKVVVTDPIRVVIINYPGDKTETFRLPNNPQDPEAGTREVPFTRELYIDRADFAEVPPPKFFRLKPGGEVRLMGSYIIKLEQIVKDDAGQIVELRCTCDLETGCGMPADGRKVKGTIHWVSAAHAISVRLNMYGRLFCKPNVFDLGPDEDYKDYLNPESLTVYENAKAEPSLAQAAPGDKFQFVRTGYFCADTAAPGTFNLTVSLKDSYKV